MKTLVLVEHADGRMEIIDWAAQKREEATAVGEKVRAKLESLPA